MIYGKIADIQQYKGMSKHFDTVIDWLAKNDLEMLPMGRTEIDGENVFVNVMNAQTRAKEQAEFEVHHQYMDLQINLSGTERYAVGDCTCEIDAQKDIGFCKGAIQTEGILSKGCFALFVTHEPHMPTLNPQDTPVMVKKVVFKIKQ